MKPEQPQKAGKKKTRLVACGIYSDREESQDLFASGATAVAVRAALTIAARMGFLGSVMDVRTAFLNGPMALNSQEGQSPKRAFIKPPALLVAAGLANPGEYYVAIMALYGYRESHRLWSDYRDVEMSNMEIDCQGGVLTLQQMITEPNMWRMMLRQPGPFETTQGACGVGPCVRGRSACPGYV